jgi:hypothetical protein
VFDTGLYFDEDDTTELELPPPPPEPWEAVLLEALRPLRALPYKTRRGILRRINATFCPRGGEGHPLQLDICPCTQEGRPDEA